jgi:hypothetical protein
LFYSPGGKLRVGIGGRIVSTHSPQGLFDPASGTFRETTVTSKSADLLADYQESGLLSANGRLGYTRQSGSQVASAEFSGWTGSLALNWRPTGKTSISLDASHDANLNVSTYSTMQFVVQNGLLTFAPIAGQYQNNTGTDTFGISASHATTAKIGLSANARYNRAKLVTGVVGSTAPETIDVGKVVSFGGNYEIKRYWSVGCHLSHEWRDVSGGTPFSYTASVVSCATQLTLR